VLHTECGGQSRFWRPRAAKLAPVRPASPALAPERRQGLQGLRCDASRAGPCVQDKNSDSKAQAEAKFKDISEAFQVGVCRCAAGAALLAGRGARCPSAGAQRQPPPLSPEPGRAQAWQRPPAGSTPLPRCPRAPRSARPAPSLAGPAPPPPPAPHRPQVLSDADKRRVYDTHGEEGLKNGCGGGAGHAPHFRDGMDIFEEVGRGGGWGGGAASGR
jgi:hypothetical protein